LPAACCASAASGAANENRIRRSSQAVIMTPIIGEPASPGKCGRPDAGQPGLASLLVTRDQAVFLVVMDKVPASERVQGPLALLEFRAPRVPPRERVSCPSSWASRSMCRESPTCVRTSHTCIDPPLGLTSFPSRVAPERRSSLLRVAVRRDHERQKSQDSCPRLGCDSKTQFSH